MSAIGPGEIAALASFAFLGALVFGVTGFGSALVAIPLALHFVPLSFALALYALSDVVSSWSVGLENPKNAVRAEWTRLVPMILVGTVLGVTLLVNLPRAAGTLLLGLFVIFFGVYSLIKRSAAKVVSPGWAWVAGLAGGITSTVFGAGGPPYVVYLSQRGLSKEALRATLGLTVMTSISLRVVAFLLTGLLLDSQVWLAAAFVCPATLTGIFIARRIFLRISREALLRLIALLLVASGSSLILRALAQM